jgi:circadian clock protein KaiC
MVKRSQGRRTPKKSSKSARRDRTLHKAATGITGLDQVTSGGLPRGRPTIVCGGPGSGKTLLAAHFLVHGAVNEDEPGVYLTFEETVDDLVVNTTSLGWDLSALVEQKKIIIDYIHVDRHEIAETGEYTLDGLFVRLQDAVDSIGAKRVVIDTPEVLFAGFADEQVLRSEIHRLFRWLKERGLTTVVTAERGETSLTRRGLEEYVSDCVIFLDQRVDDDLSTRRLRVVKYRGTSHGTNEYPFLISATGLAVVPVTSLGLDYSVSTERISIGVARIDEMLGGKGLFRGSSVLVSGTAGTGKSSVVGHFADASCKRGEKVLYFALEEPRDQIVRNMRSIGLDLKQWVDRGKLLIQSTRPTLFGLEMHLATMHQMVEEFAPDAVVIDPITSLMAAGNERDVKSMLVRLFDYLKMRGVTAVLTYLSHPGGPEQTDLGVSSLIDTWIEGRNVELGGERDRALHIVKSRGMAHSKQVREFLITDEGIAVVDAKPLKKRSKRRKQA